MPRDLSPVRTCPPASSSSSQSGRVLSGVDVYLIHVVLQTGSEKHKFLMMGRSSAHLAHEMEVVEMDASVHKTSPTADVIPGSSRGLGTLGPRNLVHLPQIGRGPP